MKFRIFGIAMAALMLLSLHFLPKASAEESHSRYHQHLEEPGYTPCEDHGKNVFCSHLPLVVIDTEGQEIPGAITGYADRFNTSIYTKTAENTSMINVSVSVIDNKEGNNHLTDTADFTTRSLFRIRGNTSRRFEKAPYLMDFVDDSGGNNEIEVMGMDAHHEWALNGPYLDKSLVRNYMWYNISGEMMEYAPNVRYCELFLNGEYRGLYLMVETITDGEAGRLNLEESYKGENMTGYLLRIDRPTEEEIETTRNIYSFVERMNISLEDVAIRYPGKNNLTPELAKEIEGDFARFEKSLYSFDYDKEDYGYQNWIDMDNFVDYYLINEFTHNVDAGRFSTYYYKEVGGKFKMCVWDFNNSCDNFVEDAFGAEGMFVGEKPFFFMLVKDEEFVERIISRYHEVRSTYFSDTWMERYIDETIQWLGPAVKRNNERWRYVFTDYEPLQPESRNLHSHEEAVEQLKTWLRERGAWMDKNIDALRAVAHPSRNKVYNN